MMIHYDDEARGGVRGGGWRLLRLFLLSLGMIFGGAQVSGRPWNPTGLAEGVSAIGPMASVGATDVTITVDEVLASGFASPTLVTHAADGSNRLFVVEKGGTIRVIKGGAVLPTPFLDITHLVESDAYERGLLGLAFHPDFESNGLFFVNYTRKGDFESTGDTVIARYAVGDSDPDVADPGSATVLLVVDQPYPNHNGGNLVFGPDGYLYLGFGDGGGGGDPEKNGQDNTTLLGAMLRIQVGQTPTYTVPADNPYVGGPGADEVWAIGLRNPWRFSFDRETGDLYIGDVGQTSWEEIDFLPADTPGGINFGWPCREGTHIYSAAPPCDDPDLLDTLIDPIAEYGRTEGQSVTGGFVYRGAAYPFLTGRYFYADFSQGKIWSIDTATLSSPHLELDTNMNISSFGEDEQGELYVVDYGGGTVRRLQAIIPPISYLPVIFR